VIEKDYLGFWYWLARMFFMAKETVVLIRFIRVSGCFALEIHSKIPLFVEGGNASKNALAFLLFANAFFKSSGITMRFTSFSAFQVPDL